VNSEVACERRIRNFLPNVRKELRRAMSDASAGREQRAVNRSGRQKISAPRTGYERLFMIIFKQVG